MDGSDDDNGSQGILPGSGGSSCGSGDNTQQQQDVPFFDLEQLLFPFVTTEAQAVAATGSNNVAIKEETHDDVAFVAKNGNGPAPLMTSSWTDSTTTIKTEEEGFSAAASTPVGGIEDLEMDDDYFSELFPDLAVAEAGIVL